MNESYYRQFRTNAERDIDDEWQAHLEDSCFEDCHYCHCCPQCGSREIISRVFDFGTDIHGYRNAGIRNVCNDCSAEWND